VTMFLGLVFLILVMSALVQLESSGRVRPATIAMLLMAVIVAVPMMMSYWDWQP
jgi:hypothetical protein